MNNNEKKNKISVIVPFYKVEKYFERCLESIVNQSFNVLEILLIDDCGNDGSRAIAEVYAKKDGRIKIITNQKNSGQGYSRNVGIKRAKGKYIAFIDSDDWLELNAYELLYEKAEETDAEIIKCDFNFIYEKENYKYDIEKYCSDFSRTYKVSDNPNFLLGLLITNVWQGIYRKDFLIENKIFFDEKLKFEDIIFEWQARIVAKKIAFVKEPLCNYNKLNPLSDTKQFNIIRDTFFQNMLIIKNFIIDKPLFHNAYIVKCYHHLNWLLLFIPKKNQQNYIKYFSKTLMKGINTDNLDDLKKLNYDINELEKFISCNFLREFIRKVLKTIYIGIYAI